MKQVSIVGAGAWGSAVALVLANNGYHVNLWCHDSQTKNNIEKTRINPVYLPDITLPKSIIPTTDFKDITNSTWVFEATPIKYLRQVIVQAKSWVRPGQRWVVLSKGLEIGTGMFPSEIINSVFGFEACSFAVTGPSYAQELARQQLTGFLVASYDKKKGEELQTMLENDYVKTFHSHDVMGAQAAAAIKNVIALAIGILDGMNCAANTKALFFVRALEEMKIFIKASDGDGLTVGGLAGIGDLILTTFGGLSRNTQIGKRIGSGESLEDIFNGHEMNHEDNLKAAGSDTPQNFPFSSKNATSDSSENKITSEGLNSIKAIYEIIQAKKLTMPLCVNVYEILFEQKSKDSLLKII